MSDGIVVSPELNPVALEVLDPIADLVEINSGVLVVDPYKRPPPPDGSASWSEYLDSLRRRKTGFGAVAVIPEDTLRRAEVLAVLLSTVKGSGWGPAKPSPAAQTMGEELNRFKLATLRSGPTMEILGVDYAPISGAVRDRRPFRDLRLAVYNGERAFRVLESYPWPGDRGIFTSAWREFHFAKLREIVHGSTLMTQDGIRTFVTLSALTRWNELVDRVNAKVAAKVRRAGRVATFQMIAFTALGLGFGAALGAGAGAFSKFVLGKATGAQQAALAGDLQDLAGSFKGDQPEFAAEIGRTAAALALQAAAVAPPPASAVAPPASNPAAAGATLQTESGGSVSPGSPVTSTPAAGASSTSTVRGNILSTLLDAIAGGIRRLLGR